MKYLFFIVHPSKYKVFRCTINQLKQLGHHVDIFITSKDVLEDLVRNEDWDYHNIFPEGRKILWLPTKIGALINLFRTIIRLHKYIGKTKYDLFITDDLLVINGRFKNVTSLLFQDDDITAVPESSLLCVFAHYILSPACSNFGRFENKKISFRGYKELGGLSPLRFKPDYSKVLEFNPTGEPYFLLRLVSLKATHDVGKKGLSVEETGKIISILNTKGKVFITSERELTDSFGKYKLKINPNDIAHALYYASFLISDSQTMSAEAGVLGVPYIRYNDFVGKISYLDELENNYQLGFGIKTNQKELLFNTIDKLLNTANLKDIWKKKRDAMLKEKIDLTDFMVWLFTNYPESLNDIKSDNSLQNQFKIIK